jgi:hypothetical protein
MPLPPLIGVSGQMRSGKDTFASFLTANGWARVAFADALKYVAVATDPIIAPLAFGGELRLARLVEEDGWESVKDNFPEARRILQTLGVAMREVDPQVWVTAAMRVAYAFRTKAAVPVVVTDVRFPNEANAIVSNGGVIVNVRRTFREVTTEQANVGHVSEHAMEPWFEANSSAYVTVSNDSDLASLKATADFLHRSMMKGFFA